MKRIFVLALFVPFFALAQHVDVKNVDASGDADSTTTIEIRKGKAAQEAAKDAKWEVTRGDADISGETAPINREAKANWKKACDEWKKEFRADNKDNKILSMSCGTPDCSGDAGNKVCNSKAAYILKTRID